MLFSGIVHVTGEHDTGKTSFALECGADPKRICFFDQDVKGRGSVADLREAGVEFGAYHDLVSMTKNCTEIGFHEKARRLIGGIKEGEFDAIIWDKWEDFAGTCKSWVSRHPQEFREQWSVQGKFKGMQEWGESYKYEASLITSLASKCKMLILITHLRDYYVNDQKVEGKQEPSCSKILRQVPKLRLWLRHHPRGLSVPMALVLKRLDKKILVPGKGIRTVTVIPRKLVPQNDEHSLWDTLRRYWENPLKERELTPDEQLTAEEISIIESTLSEQQRSLLQDTIRAEISSEDRDLRSRFEELLRVSGMSIMEIASKLKVSVEELESPTRKHLGALERLLPLANVSSKNNSEAKGATVQ